MADHDSPLGGPLELPGGEQPAHRPHAPQRQKRGVIKKVLLGLVVLAVLGGIGFAAGKLVGNPSKDENNATASNAATPAQAQPKKTSDIPTPAGFKKFESSSLGLELQYPTGWTAAEANGGVRIESPEFSYETTDRGMATGNFRVYIRKGARDVDSKYIGQGVATQPSEKLAYANPTSTQRKETNLSFFGLDTADQFAYFLVAGNFELKKGDTLGPNYGKEADTFIVTGGYSAKTLTDDFATNQVPLDTFNQSNAYKQAIDILKSLRLL